MRRPNKPRTIGYVDEEDKGDMYTKGEWTDKKGMIVANEADWITNEVARVYHNKPTEEELANAQLIASAPKQNEAIKAMVALIVAQYPALMKSYPYQLMTEALAKTEGKYVY